MYRYNRRCTCDRCKAHALLGPAVMVTVGVLFLLQEFGSWRVGFDHTWPVILIVIGAVILARRNAPTSGHVDPAQEYVMLQQHPATATPAPVPQNPDTEVNHG